MRCLSVSHVHAAAEVRARFALTESERCRLYVSLRPAADRIPGAELLLLDTCNRTELYLAADTPEGLDELGDAARHVLAGIKSLTRDELAHLQDRTGLDAAQHLCEVAAGLQSVVLGETQILQQLKDAYALAHAHEASGPVLHSMVHLAFKAGRRARTETGIGAGQVSVSSAGVEFAKSFFNGSLAGRTALLVGAGKISRLAVSRLVDAGVSKLVLANRNRAKADDLAAVAMARNVPAEVIALEDAAAFAAQVDVVFSAVADCRPGAPLLDAAALAPLAAAVRGADQPLLLVDLGMPANICPNAVALLPGNVTRVGIDQLDQLTSATRARREEHVPAVHAIVQEELAALTDLSGAITESVLAALYRRFSDISHCEVARQGQYGLPATQDELSGFALRLVRKLLAPVSRRYGQQAGETGADALAELETLVALFGLEDLDAHTPAAPQG